MSDEIIRPQDVEQVMFLGWNSVVLAGYNDMIPTMGGEYADIYAYSKRFRGLSFKNFVIKSIHKNRICNHTISVGGKRTLVVLADVHSVDKNRSFLDLALKGKDTRIEKLMQENDYLRKKNEIYKNFIEEHGMEENFKERLLNMAELVRVASNKMSSKPEAPPVSVEVGSSDDGKK